MKLAAIAMIPLEDRAALEEAREKSPELVATESDPLRFLRYVDCLALPFYGLPVLTLF